MVHLSTTSVFLKGGPSLNKDQFIGPDAAGPGGYDNIQFRTWEAFRNTPSMQNSYTDWCVSKKKGGEEKKKAIFCCKCTNICWCRQLETRFTKMKKKKKKKKRKSY
eukprot:TRINITY_DN9179_c0_g1_i2.p1 TRINITY_DN9179_c0_g1~~TRINITY_DN9179_c0_g1_i2.p1  ORF type:complete len:106 (+),score=10.34 TRINITY_DN9179_c0_g1_i2:49-366(+)